MSTYEHGILPPIALIGILMYHNKGLYINDVIHFLSILDTPSPCHNVIFLYTPHSPPPEDVIYAQDKIKKKTEGTFAIQTFKDKKNGWIEIFSFGPLSHKSQF